MEVKRFFAVFSTVFAALMLLTCAHAADEVIFENGAVETADSFQDLDGWGRELFSRCIFEADVVFKGEGAGFTLRSSDNLKGGTSIRAVMRNDKLTLAADGGTGSNYIYYIELDTETTYHISLIGSYGVSNGSIDMTVDTLDADGNTVDTKNYYLILMNKMFASSLVGPEHIRIEANTRADNIRVTELRPDSLKLVSPPAAITPGSSTAITARPQRGGADLDYALDISYSVSGEGVSIDSDGMLTVSVDAPPQNITVTASAPGMSDSADISVVSEDIFTINGAVLTADGRRLEAVKAVKSYFFDGTAVFVAAVYGADGTLKDSFVKYVPARSIGLKKESEIAMGYDLPDGFSAESDTIELAAWSAAPSAQLPETGDEVAVRKYFEENGGAVEWIDEHRVVVGMLNGRTLVLQIGSEALFVDGEMHKVDPTPFINESSSTVVTGTVIDLLR